jgi:hypothetical protein
MKAVLKGLIKIYAYLISPLMGPSCRFHPTCSAYAMEAIDVHGAVKGGILGFRRIMKCHPWHKGQYLDPVPPKAPASVDRAGIISYKRANNNHSNT